MLPYYCHNLERKNQGTVTRIKTDEKEVFEMLFIAIGASIHTFLNCLRPFLIIDATHLKGLYKGINLVVVGMDGNNQIVPIAFGICKGETGPCWSCWMSVLKECIGDNPNLIFISDRHPAIALAVHNEFPLAFHAAYTPEEFARNMSILQAVQPDAYHKLCEAGPQAWSRAHFPLVSYNYMTSNSVESVNACSVINRKLPVLKLAETYRAMVQDWYYKRRELAANMMYEIIDLVANKVTKKRMKSATWVVNNVNHYQYQVLDGQYTCEVNLQTGIGECRKWQLSGISCGHVIAVTRNMQQWEFPHNIQKAIPPRMENPQPDRPKNTNRIQSQGEESRIWDKEDVHDLRSVETEFPAIVFNDTLTSEAALSCEPTVSSLNNDEIDFRISFDESDDEDCTVIFDKNSFSYKIISVNNLKTDSENDNDKVNMPLLPSPKPTVSYFDDLDFFNNFENEFPAIVYNDAQTSKSDLLTEPV
ncbi:transposase, MuDR, MULE transposase domain protein, partial [Tanacetum coccineum]